MLIRPRQSSGGRTASMITAAAVLLGGMAIGCAQGARTPAALGERTPFPLPSGATALALATEPPATPPPSGVSFACPAAGYGSIELEADGSFRQVESGTTIALIWPRGFSLIREGGITKLLAPDGSVVLSAGSYRSDIGGSSGEVCLVGTTDYLPVR